MRLFIVSASLLFCSCSAYALYNERPAAELRDAPGIWTGTLIYNDYSEPGKLVTLKTTAFVSMNGPEELAVLYVFDDGPGKTVYSYEQMSFDFAKSTVRWTSGAKKKGVTTSHIQSNELFGERRQIVFANPSGDHEDKHTLEISAESFTLRKDEIDASGKSTMRDEYRFERTP